MAARLRPRQFSLKAIFLLTAWGAGFCALIKTIGGPYIISVLLAVSWVYLGLILFVVAVSRSNR